MFSVFGMAGQIFADIASRRSQRLAVDGERPPLWQRAAHSRWSPMKPLSDEQYLGVLQEKLLRIDVEVAIIDDEIQKLNAPAGVDSGPEGQR